MANDPTLPPQAYTRETLGVAFQWLQSQPESTKKLAQTPDALVGLYLRAQRSSSVTSETDPPVTSQNFISDLKHLAEGFKPFESPRNEIKGMQSPQPDLFTTPAKHPTDRERAPLTQPPDPRHLTVSLGIQDKMPSSSRPVPATPQDPRVSAGISEVSVTSTSSTTSTYHHKESSRNASMAGLNLSPPFVGRRPFEPMVTASAPLRSDKSLAQASRAGDSKPPTFQYNQGGPGEADFFAETIHAITEPPHSPYQETTPSTSQTNESFVATDRGSDGQDSTPLHAGSREPRDREKRSAESLSAPTVLLARFLSPRSQAMIHEVKEHLNLSSEVEVLNMMVAIAYKKVKTLLT